MMSAAPAQHAQVPSLPGEIKLSFAPAVKRVTPAASRGDIVVSVNNARISVIEDLLRAISQPVRLWRLTIMRGGQEISAVFGG
jgi:S1-C subfamily serine protease